MVFISHGISNLQNNNKKKTKKNRFFLSNFIVFIFIYVRNIFEYNFYNKAKN